MQEQNNNKNLLNKVYCKIKTIKYKKNMGLILLNTGLLIAASRFATTTATMPFENQIMKETIEEEIIANPVALENTEIPSMQIEETPNIVEIKPEEVCFLGDSRTMGFFDTAFNSKSKVYAKSDIGLTWLKETGLKKFDKIADSVKVCVVAIGKDELKDKELYVKSLNEIVTRYPDHYFVFLNVGPIDYTKYKEIQTEDIIAFNEAMASGLNEHWQILDQYSFLTESEFDTIDGVHYTKDVCEKLYNWIIESTKEQKPKLD